MRGDGGDRARGYRRGSVMGLTVAEAFMLIAFVLLMLLGVWMASARERIVALEAEAAEARSFFDAFDEMQRAAALANRDQLTLLGNELEKLEAFRDLAERGATPTEAALAMELLPALAAGLDPAEALDRVRLLDEETVRDLAEAAVLLPPEAQATLVNLARLDALPELDALRALGPEDRAVAEELAAWRATGLDPAAAAGLAERMGAVTQARLEAAEARDRVATALVSSIGPLVTGLGGEVRADGTIVFSDALLFDAGSARLLPAFDEKLAAFCRPWMTTLYERRDDLASVRIEGHASSEWLPLAPRQAYERNLDLSQARAAAVFKRCLFHSGDDRVADWARTRMSAVGFSSARPVRLGDGAEDPIASRRVVFAIDTRGPSAEPPPG